MKKVLYLFFLSLIIGGPVIAQTISASNPAAVIYTRNTQFSITGSITGRTPNKANNFVDIIPLYPDASTLNRTYWKLGTTSTYVSIPFNVYKQGSYTYPILAVGTSDTVTTNNVWLHNVRNTNFTDNYEILITSNPNAYANGTYTKVFRARLWYDATITAYTNNVSVDITVSLTISGNTTTLGLSVSSIDFGEVTTNETGGFTANVDSMQPYSLTMSSSNSYKLEYYNPLTLQIEPISGENVAYEVLINGKTYSSTLNPGNVATITSVTDPVSHSYPGTVTLKTVTAITGGEYRDTLTFTVTAP